ncbi:MAG TPA: hypothetical protein EYP33_03465 [Pyrodictium sp.]|nr:hypothetical protein [Pyrodictium sp.]
MRERGRLSSQWRSVGIAAEAVAELVEKGYRVVATHGNGPQVGMLLEWMYKASCDSSDRFLWMQL